MMILDRSTLPSTAGGLLTIMLAIAFLFGLGSQTAWSQASEAPVIEWERTYGGEQTDLVLHLPVGDYHAKWLSPITGEVLKEQKISHNGGDIKLASPNYEGEIALGIVGR